MAELSELSDNELVAEITRNKSRALEELYDRYSPVIYTLAKKIAPDEKSAENIVVDVFSLIWKKAKELNLSNLCVYTWIITLTRNKAIDMLKRSRSAEATLDYYDDLYEDNFIIPVLSEEAEHLDIKQVSKDKEKIENALNGLTDIQKYVIHLAFYEGYNINEIVERLGIPKETVRAKINTALNRLCDNFYEGS